MTHISPHRFSAHCHFAALLLFVTFAFGFAIAAEGSADKTFDVPAGDAGVTIKEFARQADRAIMYPSEPLDGVRTNAIKGSFAPREALDRMLAGTSFAVIEDEKTGALAVKRASDPNAVRAAPAKNSDRPTSPVASEEKTIQLAKFEVMDSKLLNMDIKRTADDPQPYVIFDRAAIAHSGVDNLEDFLKQRLTMDVEGPTSAQQGGGGRGQSQINLRGLGYAQTLILVDGRRLGSPALQGLPLQPDINVIPLESIERVEVLPTTSSGIYGGGATGGVINIILKRDYSGAEFKFTFDDSFHGNSPSRRVDLSAGFNLEGGKTNILITGSYTNAERLTLGDNGLYQQDLAHILANDPAFLTASSLPLPGTTPNIKSSTGTNLTLKNGTPLNFPITSVPLGYTGAASDGGAALVANAGRYNLTLPNTATGVRGTDADLLDGAQIESIDMTVRRQFSSVFQGYLELSGSNNRQINVGAPTGFSSIPATAPTNPFQQAISVLYPVPGVFNDVGALSLNRRLATGAIVKLPRDWTAAADYTVSWGSLYIRQPNGLLTTTSAAIAAGTIDVLHDPAAVSVNYPALTGQVTTFPQFVSHFADATLRVSGPVGSLPAGRPTLSSLVEYRPESFSGEYIISAGSPLFYPGRSQSDVSEYVEAFLPIIGAPNRLPGVEELSVQLAARHDAYTLHGANSALTATTALILATDKLHSTDPTVAVRYKPVPDVILRASYGTGFSAPNVSQLAPLLLTTSLANLVDPRRGNQALGTVQEVSGGNPNLGPEKSKSVSAGIVVTPRQIPGLRLSADYTAITKTNNIATLTAQQILSNESIFPGRVIRSTPAAGDPFAVGPVSAIDISAVNISGAKLQAYDFAADYEVKTSQAGVFTFFGGLTLTEHYKTQLIASVPWVEVLGLENALNAVISPGTTLKTKGNGGMTWKFERWTLGWSFRYYHSYLVADPSVVSNALVLAEQGNAGRVPEQIYHDVLVGYKIPRVTGRLGEWLSDWEIQAGVKNIFDKTPPLDAGQLVGYYSGFADPRIQSYYVSFKKAF